MFLSLAIGYVKHVMMTSSNGNISSVTGHLRGEFTGHRWIPRTKASDAELCDAELCFFSLISVWINGWVNNREAGDLRRYHAHYDVIVMWSGIGFSVNRPNHYLDQCWPSQYQASFVERNWAVLLYVAFQILKSRHTSISRNSSAVFIRGQFWPASVYVSVCVR